MLPEAISCSLGFQTWVRFLSISVIAPLPRLPSVSPSLVASSSPPAPPPTMTMRCLLSGMFMERTRRPADGHLSASRRHRHVGLGRVEHGLGVVGLGVGLVVELALHAVH